MDTVEDTKSTNKKVFLKDFSLGRFYVELYFGYEGSELRQKKVTSPGEH